MDFKYEVKDIDEIVDEKGNTIIKLSKISWNGRDPKLELRKWRITEDGERADKGFAFLTNEGPNELTHALVRLGYGDTRTLVDLLMERVPEMKEDLDQVQLPESTVEYDEEEYFDPKRLLE